VIGQASWPKPSRKGIEVYTPTTATTDRGAKTEEEEREPGSAVGEDERPEEGAMVVHRPWLVPRRRLCRRAAAEGGQARRDVGRPRQSMLQNQTKEEERGPDLP